MAFNSASFVLLLLVTLLGYFSTRNLLVRQLLLVVVSAAFYAVWDYRFVALLFYVTFVAYAGGQAVRRWPSRGRAILFVAVALQLSQLLFFKYTNFLWANLGELTNLFGAQLQPARFDIVLPVGVSFYTFHGISYVVDVYRGKLERPQSPLVVALYIAFFPQLIAGPIVRADVFIPQSKQVLQLDTRDLIVGFKFITVGLIYKCVFADRLAPLVDQVFQHPEQFQNGVLARAALGFYAQIYFDFAGYSTMAIGVSRLFGFKLPKNFDFPYRATSITDFWKRWHISLSSWLRDYLYIPLGGNRAGRVQQYRNLMLTMLLGGLWHGASFNFVFWGGLHGAALSVHKWWSGWAERIPSSVRFVHLVLAWALTQAFVLLAWIPFRAESFEDTLTFSSALLGVRDDADLQPHAIPMVLLVLPILVDHLLVQNRKLPAFPWPKRPWLVLAVLALCFTLALPFIIMETTGFIYFQF
jgi:alginate O-acetyltransferase complex protein AlgI